MAKIWCPSRWEIGADTNKTPEALPPEKDTNMKQPFTIDCPNCKADIEIDFATAKEGQRIPCPSCNLEIAISGPEWQQARDAIQALKDSVAQVGKSLRR